MWRRDPGAFCAYGRADVHEKHSAPVETEGWNARIKDPLDRGGQGLGQQCRLNFDEIIHRLVLFAAACKVRMWEDYKATLRNESQGDAAGNGLVPETSRVPKPRKVKKSPNPTPPTSEDAAMARAMAAGRAPSDLRLDPTTGDALFGVVLIKPRLSFRLPSRHFACVFFRGNLFRRDTRRERRGQTRTKCSTPKVIGQNCTLKQVVGVPHRPSRTRRCLSPSGARRLPPEHREQRLLVLRCGHRWQP